MADNKKSSLIGMVSTLLIISSVAAFALGQTYELTKEPIAQVKLKKDIEAIKKVLPPFNNTPNDSKNSYTLEKYSGLIFYRAENDGKFIGTAVKTFSNNGFSGDVWLMVGFLPDGTIHNIEVLDHKETPGLGSKMSENRFKSQFSGKNPKDFNLKVKKDGGDVDAITASTISSRAFGDGVQKAYNAYIEGGRK